MIGRIDQVYTHDDFSWERGIQMRYSGEPVPESDWTSIHAGPPPAERPNSPRPSRRSCPPTPAVAALLTEMKAQRLSYDALATRLGVSGKTLSSRLHRPHGNWRETYREAALELGRPELLRHLETNVPAPARASARTGRAGPVGDREGEHP